MILQSSCFISRVSSDQAGIRTPRLSRWPLLGQVLGEGGGWWAKIKYFAATKLAELIQNNGKSNAKGFEQCFGLSFRSVCDT